jgi:DNA polymerase
MAKFFWPNKVENAQPIARTIKTKVLSCSGCGLYAGAKTPHMKPTGEGKLGIFVVAEAPGLSEDLEGIQLIGDAGQYLRSELNHFKLDLDRDFWKSNACRCRPPQNRKPTNYEIECCRKEVWSQIKECSPRAIWLMGGSAVKSFFWDFEKEDPNMAKWRGWCIPNYEYNAWILPQYHPSFLIRNPNDRGLGGVFRRDIENAINNSRRPLPKFWKPKVNKITSVLSIRSLLRRALEDKRPFVFDYETTGLKPYREGHKIVYAGFSRDGRESFAFPFLEEIKEDWINILVNPEIPKVAHAMKFEELWSRVILGVEVQNWHWCTQLAAHCLDDREEITALKFQIAIRYGEMTFKDESDPWLRAPHGNDFNNILKAPKDIILQRVGDDAGWEARLYCDQTKEMKAIGHTGLNTLEYGFEFFKEGSLAFVDAEQAGIRIDEKYLDIEKGKLEDKISQLRTKILNDANVKRFFGNKFNPKSDVQLRKLLYTDLGLKPIARTPPTKAYPMGNPKVDKAVLDILARDQASQIGPLISDTINYRRYETTHSTFIVGLIKEAWDGELHPFFNLHLARSYRSSSDKVNFQNQPVRDEETSDIVRGAFFPFWGHQLLEADFSGIEVRIAACHTQDPVLIKYIEDKTSDMHRDQAMRLFLLPERQVTKVLRYNAKNQFVFPEFYGSWWGACAENLWNSSKNENLADGTPLLAHLANKGIRNFKQFEELVEQEEYKFWDKFKVYAQWKEEQLELYYKTGKIPLYFGFQRQGYLGRNKVLNTSIQGTAFHCLLWCFIQLNNLRKAENWQSRIMGQIHDSIVMSIYPPEKIRVLQALKQIMTKDLVETFPWAIVPMVIEIEMAKRDEPWSKKKPLILDW